MRQKQRAKSSMGQRPSRNAQVNSQMSHMLSSLNQNPFFNNYLINNDFQNMTLMSKEKLIGFQKIYNKKQLDQEENQPLPQPQTQMLTRKKSKKKPQSMTNKQIKGLIRQNKNLGQKYNKIADTMMRFMNVDQVLNEDKNPRNLRDQGIQLPSVSQSNNQDPSSPGGQAHINNTGSLNKSANIYYNRIQNLTINARRPQEVLENFISNNPLQDNHGEESRLRDQTQSPVSNILPNIQMFSFEDSQGNPKIKNVTNTGRMMPGKRQTSANITNKAEIDEAPAAATEMSDFLNQNIQSINPSVESFQIKKLKDMQQKKRVQTQMKQPQLEDDVQIQKLIFAMRDELEKKKEIYGEDKLQVLQHAIDKIMNTDELQTSSQETFKLLNHPVKRPNTQQSDYKLESKVIQTRLIKKLKSKYQENLKTKLKEQIDQQPQQQVVVDSLQSMFSKDMPQDVDAQLVNPVSYDQDVDVAQQESSRVTQEEVEHLYQDQDQLYLQERPPKQDREEEVTRQDQHENVEQVVEGESPEHTQEKEDLRQDQNQYHSGEQDTTEQVEEQKNQSLNQNENLEQVNEIPEQNNEDKDPILDLQQEEPYVEFKSNEDVLQSKLSIEQVVDAVMQSITHEDQSQEPQMKSQNDDLQKQASYSNNDYQEQQFTDEALQNSSQLPMTQQVSIPQTMQSNLEFHSFRDYGEQPQLNTEENPPVISVEVSPIKFQNLESDDDNNIQQESLESLESQGPPESTQEGGTIFNSDEMFLLDVIDLQEKEKTHLQQIQKGFERIELESSRKDIHLDDLDFQTQATQIQRNFKFSQFEPRSFITTSTQDILSDLDRAIIKPEIVKPVYIHKIETELMTRYTDQLEALEHTQESHEWKLTRDHSIGVVNPDINEFDMYEVELRVETALNEIDDQKYETKFKSPIKDNREAMNQKDREDFEIYAKYADMVWERKNNKTAFIIFNDDKQIDESLSKIDLFDIKTNVNLNNVYDQIDWDLLQSGIAQMDLKYQDIDDLVKHSPGIDQFLVDFYDEFENFYTYQFHTQDQLLCIPKSDMRVLRGQFSNILRLLPIVMKFKIALQSKAMKKFSNDVVFSNRYDNLLERYKFQEKQEKLDYFIEDVERRQDLLGLKNELNEYTSMMVIDSNNRYSFYQLLFKHQTSSLYDIMYDPSQDFMLNQMFDNLYMSQKEIFVQSLLKEEGIVGNVKIDKDHLTKMIVNSKRLKTWDHSKRQFLLDELLQDMDQKTRAIIAYSDRDGEHQKNLVRPFTRQDALNNCSDKICKLQVIRQLDKILLKAKDSINMIYYRIETIINKDDQDYNNFAHLFGYKCNYIRNPDNVKCLMEVYLPILKKDGQRKIRQRKHYMNNIRTNSSNKLKESKYSKRVQVQKEKNKLEMRFKEMLMVEDYHTDDSMREIDFKDIKEDQSEDDDPKKIQKKHSIMEKLGNFCSPIEHYQHLRINREKLGDNISRKSSTMCLNSMKGFGKNQNYQSKFAEDLAGSEHIVNPIKFQKNKNKIEVMIMQTQANIIHENIEEANKIKSSNQYIRTVRDQAIEHFGSMENYYAATQGKVLEDNLKQIELDIKKSVQELENQNYRIQKKTEGEQNRQKRIKKLVSFAEEIDIVKIQKKLENEDNEKEFMVNNEIEILKAIQFKKKEERQKKMKKQETKNKILNMVNKQQKVVKDEIIEKQFKKETAQMQALRKFQEQLVSMYQERKEVSNLQSTIEDSKVLQDKKSTQQIFKVSISKADTLKSVGPYRMSCPKKHTKCMSQNDKTHLNFKRRMFKAIETSNCGLMKDILDRYSNQDEYNGIIDADGNTLVCLAALHGDQNMIKLLVEHGFDPQQANNNGDTPLHHAISQEQRKCIDILLTKGVNERVKNNKGQLPWELS